MDKINALLNDLSLTHPAGLELVQLIRKEIYTLLPDAGERVMYGGLMFTAGKEPFCGIFAYTAHVSVEFSQGALLSDPAQVLEGKGKFRRHIKIYQPSDIQSKQLSDYLARAAAATPAGDAKA
jgi:hypothetical protein